MPKDRGAGYSTVTPVKHHDLGYIIGTWIDLTAGPKFRGAPWAHPEFLYWDLNAGPGMVNGEMGSPLISLREARVSGEPFRAWFHEKNLMSCDALRLTIAPDWGDRVTVVPGDHAVTVPDLIRTGVRGITRQAYGLAFSDPNGRDDLALDALRAIAKRFPKVDFLLNLGAMNWKRIRSVGKPGRFLHEDLAQIPKRYIFVRRPVGPNQWTMFLFTDYKDAPRLKKLGFFDIASPEGEAILRKLDLLPAEYYQSPLFDLAPLRRTRPIVNISDIRATEQSGPMPSPDATASASDAASSG
jgi:hypothetical protein